MQTLQRLMVLQLHVTCILSMPCNTLQSAKEIHWKKRRECACAIIQFFFLKNLGLYVIWLLFV